MATQRHDADKIVENSPMTQQSGYQPASEMTSQNGAEAKHAVAEKARDVASHAQEKAIEVGHKAADVGLDKAASGMQTAASKLRDQAGSADGMAHKAGVKVADGMESTAGYLQEHDTTEITETVRKWAKAHPVQAIAGALAGAYVLGRIFR